MRSRVQQQGKRLERLLARQAQVRQETEELTYATGEGNHREEQARSPATAHR